VVAADSSAAGQSDQVQFFANGSSLGTVATNDGTAGEYKLVDSNVQLTPSSTPYQISAAFTPTSTSYSASTSGPVPLTVTAGSSLHVIGFGFNAAIALPVSVTTATLSDSDVHSTASQLSASINWGDGSATTPAQINIDNDSTRCPCTVNGTHAYHREGTFQVTTTITKTDSSGVVSPHLGR
jgi:hypothetical protein